MTPSKSPYAKGFDDGVDACQGIMRRSMHALAERPCSSPHHLRLMLDAINALERDIAALRTDAPDPCAPVDPVPPPAPVAPAAAAVAA